MSIIIKNLDMPIGCQKCKFFRKHMFGNVSSYSCILGAKDFPMPCIRQMEERASDCPIEPLEQESVLDKTKAEIEQIEIDGHIRDVECFRAGINTALNIIDKYKAESEEE